MRNIILIIATCLVSSCEYAAGDLGKCHVDAFTAFCVVNTPKDTTAIAGTGIVPAVGTAAGGVGSLLIGQGAILSGTGVLLK